ncbi:acetyltransferase-like isoleucine patch superfamily enzyme [Elizabethkingia sp. YR214]|nr:acetyltransferase-like isoleucine patch superfamily enzyme [Elizabethkingia sp. YR214]
MSTFFKNIIRAILKFFPYKSLEKIKRYRNIFYTHWIKDDFATFGDNSYLERGLRLWNIKYISIGSNVVIRRMSNLSAWDSYTDKKYSPSIKIGNDCSIGEFFNLSCINEIVLGNNVLIGRWVTVIDHSHGYLNEAELQVAPAERDLVSKGKIIIEDNVWIGDKVTICPNVHIHKGAIIGANSVVTHDVEANTIVAGCPARVIKTFNNKN